MGRTFGRKEIEMAIVNSSRGGRMSIQDGINLLCAVLLFISPWVLHYSGDSRAAGAAWIGAILVGAFSIAALTQFAEWEEWVTTVLGVCIIAAPWVLGFAALTHVVYAFVALGVIIVVASLSELWMVHNPTATVR